MKLPPTRGGQCPKALRSTTGVQPTESVLQTRNSAAGRRSFGLRWQSAAATPLSERGPGSKSGVARQPIRDCVPAKAEQARTFSRLPPSQPGGLPDGSRWSYGATGERPPEDVYRDRAPQRGARRGLEALHPGSHDGALRNQSGTPAGVQVNSCAAIRRSPPPRPPATSGDPLPTLRVDKARMSESQRAGGKRDSSCHLPPSE